MGEVNENKQDRMLTSQQEAFLSYYLDPKSETWSNARQSALKAGYAENYANNITDSMPDWLLENVGDHKRLNKAEKNLDKLLEQDDDLKVQADITKFVAERLGKRKYSLRQELTGAEGKPLIIPSELIDKNRIEI